jgi:hypothetical protein
MKPSQSLKIGLGWEENTPIYGRCRVNSMSGIFSQLYVLSDKHEKQIFGYYLYNLPYIKCRRNSPACIILMDRGWMVPREIQINGANNDNALSQ